jgi:hypothetical protein
MEGSYFARMKLQKHSPQQTLHPTPAGLLETEGVIKWVQLGDENTKLFHANATIRNRRNSIPCLIDPSGTPLYNHNSKAKLI